MSHHRFPVIPGSIAVLPSRRDVLRGLAVAELGLGLTGLPASLAARKKRKRKDKKPKLQRNLYGCVDVGGKCHGNDGNCCSGICQGKKPRKGQKDKSRCAAHGVDGCQPDEDQCAFVQAPCGDGGICFRTTGNANFCGDFTGLCVACRTDPDCEAETGPGSACVVCPFCAESGGTACWPPPNPA
jgi:hypothetical protein